MTQEFSAYPPFPDRPGTAPERFAQFADDQHGDLVLTAYHADVGFLEALSSELIERNATAFARMRDLLVSIDPSMIRAKDGTIWESAYRGHYDERLAEIRNLVIGLSAGFDKARVALFRYADEVKRAKQRLGVGVQAERKLDNLISSVAVADTLAARQTEPMRRWEDIRDTAGFRTWATELGMDLASIRDEVTSAYNEAGDEFGRAQSIERAAREVCLAELRRAYDLLPDIHGGCRHAVAIIVEVVPLRAATRPDAWLPSREVRYDSFTAGEADISPALQWIRDLLATLPAGRSQDRAGAGSDDDCYDFIAANKELIDAGAHEFGLPPDLLAVIAWRELGGTPHPLEVLTEVLRRAADGDWARITAQSLPSSAAGAVDDTDFGPMAALIRRTAEVLGYNPASLSGGQLNEIETALRDPAQHIFIAAKYLAQLKAEMGFADVPADQLTYAQYQELAARYNDGLYWSGGVARSYGREFLAALDQARAALG